jgi:hypothetical protein
MRSGQLGEKVNPGSLWMSLNILVKCIPLTVKEKLVPNSPVPTNLLVQKSGHFIGAALSSPMHIGLHSGAYVIITESEL